MQYKVSFSVAVLVVVIGMIFYRSSLFNENHLGIAESTESLIQTEPDQNVTLRTLLDNQAAEFMRNAPEFATLVGIPEAVIGASYNHRLSDYSSSAARLQATRITRFISELEAIPIEQLDAQGQLNRDVTLAFYRASLPTTLLAGSSIIATGESPYVITQLTGPHIEIPAMLESQQPLNNYQDIQNYTQRVAAFPLVLAQSLETIQANANHGLIPPAAIIERTQQVLRTFIEPLASDNIIVTTLTEKVSNVSKAQADAAITQVESIVANQIYPAYQKIADFYQSLTPQAASGDGIWAQPDGDILYAHLAHILGDTEWSPEDIHQLGLREVSRIAAEMDTILSAQGYTEGNSGERVTLLSKDPRFLYSNDQTGRTQLIDDLNQQVAEVNQLAPQFFTTLPPQSVEVRRIPEFSEEGQPGGYYSPPALDGSRDGIYWINLRDTHEWPSFMLKTLTYHEAIPGHHFQIALNMNQTDLPLFRQLGFFNAYNEGWGLYAEKLAQEMGLYQDDPYGDLGRLQSEMFRAVRLVVDTGLHYKRWSREQAIQYMLDNVGNTRSEATTEIERYMVIPGQALGYMLGMLKIIELRDLAHSELGPKFSIKAFHDAVLLPGAMPMNTLEQQIKHWIQIEKHRL